MLYKDLLKEDRPCPFCVRAPHERLETTDSTFLTYALAPYHKHHLLVVPERHVVSFTDLTEPEHLAIAAMLERGVRLLNSLGYENNTVLVRDGDATGKSVGHLHYHIIPNTRIGDIDHDGNERTVLSPEETAMLYTELTHKLNTLPQVAL